MPRRCCPCAGPITHYDAVFGRGVVTFTSESPSLALEQKLFVAPDEPVVILLLTLRNRTDREQIYRIAPVLEIILAETPPDLVGALETETDDSGRGLYFANPRNEFVHTWAFVSTSLDADLLRLFHRVNLGRPQLAPIRAFPSSLGHGQPTGAPRTMAAAPPDLPA